MHCRQNKNEEFFKDNVISIFNYTTTSKRTVDMDDCCSSPINDMAVCPTTTLQTSMASFRIFFTSNSRGSSDNIIWGSASCLIQPLYAAYLLHAASVF
mmetsp:Transcript_2394/g.3327  ORF Transcript_2394/g.3327 Transcript_2394/m.3327 type:complete len:98 (+) Transcript_2394:30-323(+)